MEHKFNPSTGYKQKGHPHPVTSCGRRRSFMTSPLNKGRCWPGFKPNPDGRPAGARGSCVPIKMLATRKEIQNAIDEILMSDF